MLTINCRNANEVKGAHNSLQDHAISEQEFVKKKLSNMSLARPPVNISFSVAHSLGTYTYTHIHIKIANIIRVFVKLEYISLMCIIKHINTYIKDILW